jgi:hypothetical protein
MALTSGRILSSVPSVAEEVEFGIADRVREQWRSLLEE